jgi:hypothetical protein
MTGQVHDSFIYEGETYSLVGIDGNDLFIPRYYDLIPFSCCTACWRGYKSTYEVSDSKLYLHELDICLEGDLSPEVAAELAQLYGGELPKREQPLLNGVAPIETCTIFSHKYENVKLPISFTGELLIASGFIKDFYIHMGFQPPSAFEKVFQLIFEEGNLQSVKNISPSKEEIKKQIQEYKEIMTHGKDPTEFIISRFKLME